MSEWVLISQDYSGYNLVFIVGAPRSGTTWLQQLLASYPRARTGPETHLFAWLVPHIRVWRDELKWAKHDRNAPGTGPFAYFREEEFFRDLKRYLIVLMQPMIGNLESGEFFIEKTPGHALYIPEIVEFFPDCKIIHILRDARDTVSSNLALNKSIRAHRGYNPSWPPSEARRAALDWVKHVGAVTTSSQNLSSNQFYEVKYRDLKASTETELLKLSQFLSWDWETDLIKEAVHRNDPRMARKAETATGLPMNGEFQAITGRSVVKTEGTSRKAVVGSWKEELGIKQKISVWLVARKMMKEVGYEWKYPW